MGKGNPEGRTVYVMRRDKESNKVELWNPMLGEAYYYGRTSQKGAFSCFGGKKGYSMNIRLNDPIC